MYFMKNNKKGGFTLLELLIVITIIAILSVALVIVLNPSETLKKARDSQRISDLSTLKTAIGLYMTSVAAPSLDGQTGASINTKCKPTPATAWGSSGTYKIWYSFPGTGITDVALDSSTGTTPAIQPTTTAAGSLTDGTGWIPVNFSAITGGSPISNIPVDPSNTIADPTSVRSSDLVYRYACSLSPLSFEIDAQLESTAYTVTDDKRASDGGNSTLYYETGTNLLILTGASPSVVATDF